MSGIFPQIFSNVYLMSIYSSGLQRVTDLEVQIVSQFSFLQGSDSWIHAVVMWMCGRTLLFSGMAAASAMISPSCTLVPVTQWFCGTVCPYMV